jgi:hypothetical protein
MKNTLMDVNPFSPGMKERSMADIFSKLGGVARKDEQWLGVVPLWLGLLLAGAAGGVFGLGGYTFVYAEGGSYFSDDPRACVNCHVMREVRLSEAALVDAIEAIVAAQEAGVSDEALAEARHLHRRASLRWDFVSSENSTGFHSPQEAARVLARAIDYARQAQLAAERASLSQAQATTAP